MDNKQNSKAFSMIADIEGDFGELTNLEMPDNLPVLAVEDLVLFPGVVSPILIGRESSLTLVKKAEKTGCVIAVVCQREPDIEEPSKKTFTLTECLPA